LKALQAYTLVALSGSVRSGSAFALALASIPAAGYRNSATALKRRLKVLGRELTELQKVFEQKGGANLPVLVRALFERPLKLLEADLKYTAYLAKELETDARNKRGGTSGFQFIK
jgi:hypothetical protein